jgi:holo-[acyl-carrier protein] synthase
MAIYCGVDIVEIDRIRQSFETIGDNFRDRVFTEAEIAYCEGRKASRFESYAARFAAKEAVSKAFGTGIGGLGWKDIEILNDDKGKPYVVLSESAKDIFEKMKGLGISLSLSHSRQYAVAYAVLEARGGCE